MGKGCVCVCVESIGLGHRLSRSTRTTGRQVDRSAPMGPNHPSPHRTRPRQARQSPPSPLTLSLASRLTTDDRHPNPTRRSTPMIHTPHTNESKQARPTSVLGGRVSSASADIWARPVCGCGGMWGGGSQDDDVEVCVSLPPSSVDGPHRSKPRPRSHRDGESPRFDRVGCWWVWVSGAVWD